MEITKQQIIEAIAAAIEAKVSNEGNLTESERADAYNAALDAVKSLDPYKGTPTVKF